MDVPLLSRYVNKIGLRAEHTGPNPNGRRVVRNHSDPWRGATAVFIFVVHSRPSKGTHGLEGEWSTAFKVARAGPDGPSHPRSLTLAWRAWWRSLRTSSTRTWSDLVSD